MTILPIPIILLYVWAAAITAHLGNQYFAQEPPTRCTVYTMTDAGVALREYTTRTAPKWGNGCWTFLDSYGMARSVTGRVEIVAYEDGSNQRAVRRAEER